MPAETSKNRGDLGVSVRGGAPNRDTLHKSHTEFDVILVNAFK